MDRDSEQELSSQIHILSDAGAGVIHLRTNELNRTLSALRLAVTIDEGRYREWDVVHGWREFDIQNRQNPDVNGDGQINFPQEYRRVDTARQEAVAAAVSSGASSESPAASSLQYYVFVNPQYWMEKNPTFMHLTEHYTKELPGSDMRVILVTPDTPLPEGVTDSVVTVTMAPPGHVELRKYLDGIFDDLSDDIVLTEEEKDQICHTGAGMTQESFEMHASVAIVKANNGSEEEEEEGVDFTSDDIIDGVNQGKTAIVNRNDLLELYPVEDMDDVGGLDHLKTWIDKRRVCFTDEAVEFGIESPKGLVFVGPPGTGKSLIAKAVAGTLRVPLIRLDFGKVFNSLVGSSEERMRMALTQVSYMAPCVLFIDEIDKGLGGIGGGGGDSGTSSRVLGTFLTWLQDNKTPVFTMVTANNIRGLPPELMRRGRIDEIFASSLPDHVDRRTILGIHLRKRGWDVEEFDQDTVDLMVEASNGHSGAEIEAAVRDGLVDAFSAGVKKDDGGPVMDHILSASQELRPLALAYKEEIAAMTVWAKENARAASKSRKTDKKAKEHSEARRRVRTRAATRKATSPARRRKADTGTVH